MIVFGLSASRKETKKMHSLLNQQKGFMLGLESDIDNISWKDSENIIINRVKFLEKKLYKNTVSRQKAINVIGEVGFYIFPYIDLLINNFPYIKFIYTNQNKNKLYKDILKEAKINNKSFFQIIFPFQRKFKNHWVHHNGIKWEKDYILDKCYPKFRTETLKTSIEKYIDLYSSGIKKLEKKHPNNLKRFYLDELKSDYGRNKILSFIGLKS